MRKVVNQSGRNGRGNSFQKTLSLFLIGLVFFVIYHQGRLIKLQIDEQLVPFSSSSSSSSSSVQGVDFQNGDILPMNFPPIESQGRNLQKHNHPQQAQQQSLTSSRKVDDRVVATDNKFMEKTSSVKQRRATTTLKQSQRNRDTGTNKTKNSAAAIPIATVTDVQKSIGEMIAMYRQKSIANYNTTTTTTTTTNQNMIPQRRERHRTSSWAYAFLIGGCNPTTMEYRGFLYNVIVASERLQHEMNTIADIVLFVQMSVQTNETRLPKDDLQLLSSNRIIVRYIPKFSSRVHENFYALVKEKFRILQLIEYDRVLFVDADIMPTCPLDYLFELSDPSPRPNNNNNHEENDDEDDDGKHNTTTRGTKNKEEPLLKENVVLAWGGEAANAGFFMLKPNVDDYRQIQEIILRKEKKALELPWPHFDVVEGWGHIITEPDYWRSPNHITGTNWTWHAAFADQGLLYYWTKYVKQSVSLIIGPDIENWSTSHDDDDDDDVPHLETTTTNALNKHTCIPPSPSGRYFPASPYRDFRHFTGRTKPWEGNRSKMYDIMTLDFVPLTHDEIWYHALKKAATRANVVPNFEFAMPKQQRDDENGNDSNDQKKKTQKKKTSSSSSPPVGRFSDYSSMIEHIRVMAENNWTAYATG